MQLIDNRKYQCLNRAWGIDPKLIPCSWAKPFYRPYSVHSPWPLAMAFAGQSVMYEKNKYV